jgi:hypothetical protein
MKIFGAIVGFVLIAGLFVFWVRAYKSIKGEASSDLFGSSGAGEGNKVESLDAFIAAYRRGQARVEPGIAAASRLAAASVSVAPSYAAPISAAPTKREPFLSGQVKLGYYLCKAGLRDHHVFVHVRIATLYAAGAPDPAASGATVDLLVCNAQLSAVAAIDLVTPGASQPEPGKSDSLKSLGIRYLRLSTKSLPRPEELHALLYRM